jgi:serine/threonine protein kinase
MELGEGGALDSIARQLKTKHANLRIGEKVIARLAEGVLKGLDYMHSNKVTHRDIKPSNILLTKAGVVKLCDFGVSGALEASLASTFTGTSWYMAVSFVMSPFAPLTRTDEMFGRMPLYGYTCTPTKRYHFDATQTSGT